MIKTLCNLFLLVALLFFPLSVNAYVHPSTLNDTYAKYQYYFYTINMGELWGMTTGSPNVVVAVIDDGVYLNHPDLKENVWQNKDEIRGNGKDDDNNGYADDYYGWNFFDNSPEMTVKGKHGTMVAGIIGAKGNNGIGVAGIAWNIKIMPLIACNDVYCDRDAVVKSIKYAVDNGADVINLSLGSVGTHTQLYDAYNEVIKYAYDRNVVVVAAAGNGDIESGFGKDLADFPVSPVCNEFGDQIIGVASTKKSVDELTRWSNYGGCSQVSAPGEEILSTAPLNMSDYTVEYDFGDGTSFSAPIVSGVAALIRSLNRKISNYEIINLINKSGEGSAYTKRINVNLLLSGIGKSVDLFSVDKTTVLPGDYVYVNCNNFNSDYAVKLVGPTIIELPKNNVSYVSQNKFRIKVPELNISKGVYSIDVDGVKLINAFTVSESGKIEQGTAGEQVNGLSLQPGWLIKNNKFVEVFSVDNNLCLHWIVNEKAAEKYFGHSWNKVIKEYSQIPAGYSYCENMQ